MATGKKAKTASKQLKKSGKPLCKLFSREYLEKNPETYRGLVREPAFLCRKCGRVAADRRHLCKSEPL